MGNAMWRFASNGNAGYTGINDSGIETFSSRIMHSLVRETIQNALDASKNSTLPVSVEFNEFQMPINRFPGYVGFKKSLDACFQDNEDADARAFFRHAVKIMDENSSTSIRVLRISDFNTIGLQGAETGEKGSNWSRLVKEKGSSNKNETAQGSFGIGKAAPFACSDLRTVFYSSLYEKENGDTIASNIGVARLISFKDEQFKNFQNDGWTTGMGFYSDNDKLNAILQSADFDPKFQRNETGTDIYIMGFTELDNFVKEVQKYVLLNFLVSLWNGKLSVTVNGETICRESLQKYIFELNEADANDVKEKKEIRDLKEYYDLLVKKEPEIVIIPLKSSVYGEKYGFADGECELRLKEGKKLNSRILLTRKSGMRLFEQDRISGSIDFTGILLMTGDTMNAKFRPLEVPSHDAWAPDRLKNPKEKKIAREMLNDLKKYLRECVNDNFGRTDKERLNAFGMAEFLPTDAQSPNVENSNEVLDGDIVDIREKEIKVSKPRAKSIERRKTTGGGEGDGVTPSQHKSNKGSGQRRRTGGEGTEEKYSYHEIAIQARIRSVNLGKGCNVIEYNAPKSNKRAKLELLITNEQGNSNDSLSINNVCLLQGTAEIDSWNENYIILKNVKKGEKIRIQCESDMNRYCMMEVIYYEAKK